MAATKAQLAALEIARKARKLKKDSLVDESKGSSLIPDDRVWLEALLVSIISKEIKSDVHVGEAIPMADAILAAYKAKFK